MKKLLSSAGATGIYLTTLVVIYYLHVTYFKVDVVFYAAIADGLIATGIAALIVLFFRYFSPLTGFEKFQLIVIWALLGYAFAISVPTVIDRSLSFYVLEKLQQRGGGIKEEAFEDIFKEEYTKEHRLIEVRLTEQLESGTIVIDDGCVKLTVKGERLVSFSRYFRQNWLPKHRLLMGEYTDALTDPFRESRPAENYRCE